MRWACNQVWLTQIRDWIECLPWINLNSYLESEISKLWRSLNAKLPIKSSRKALAAKGWRLETFWYSFLLTGIKSQLPSTTALSKALFAFQSNLMRKFPSNTSNISFVQSHFKLKRSLKVSRVNKNIALIINARTCQVLLSWKRRLTLGCFALNVHSKWTL